MTNTGSTMNNKYSINIMLKPETSNKQKKNLMNLIGLQILNPLFTYENNCKKCEIWW